MEKYQLLFFICISCIILSCEEKNLSIDEGVPSYTQNLLKNGAADDGLDEWEFIGPSSIDTMHNNPVFYIKNDEDGVNGEIKQEIYLDENYDGKYVLIIGNIWAENPIGSTGYSSIWAEQKGELATDAWPYMQSRIYKAGAQIWQTHYGVYKIHEGATSILLKLAQSNSVRETYNGSKAVFDDLEVRIFDDEEDAYIYAFRTYVPSTH